MMADTIFKTCKIMPGKHEPLGAYVTDKGINSSCRNALPFTVKQQAYTPARLGLHGKIDSDRKSVV